MTNLALFIDGDNASPTKFLKIYEELKLRGNISIRKLYTDITKEPEKWKKIWIDLAIEAVHVTNLSRKESSDMKMIVEIMETLFTHTYIDTFVIISSDSDYSSVSQTIRKYGKNVIGIGEEQTPKLLINSCNEFIFFERNENNSFKAKKLEKIQKINTIINKISDKDIIQKFIQNGYKYVCPIENTIVEVNLLRQFPQSFVIKNEKIYIIKKVFSHIIRFRDSLDKNKINLSLLKDKLKLLDNTFHEKLYEYNSFRTFMNELFGNLFKESKGPDGTIYIEFLNAVL